PRTALGFRNRVACQAHVSDAGHSCPQRKNGSFARRSPGYVAFVCRARQTIVDVVQVTVLPAWLRPAEFHGSLSLHWLTTRLMFPRIGPAAQLAPRAIASVIGEDHLRARGLAHVMGNRRSEGTSSPARSRGDQPSSAPATSRRAEIDRFLDQVKT